jgi:hypothetical protein
MMRVSLVGEVLVTVTTIAVVWWVLRLERGAATVGWAVAAGLHTVVVWGFSIWNRNGIWRPLGASTRDYFRLAQERLRRQRRSAEFALGLVLVEVAALVAWVGLDSSPERSPRPAWNWLPAVVVTTVTIGWAGWYRRRAVRRLARLRGLEAQLLAEDLGVGNGP